MRIVAPIIVFSLLIVAGCSAPTVKEDATDTSGSVIVHMRPGGFDPESLTVTPGAKVCFTNDDSEARWPASNIHPTHEIYPEFDPKTPVRSGETWCFTVKRAGIWKFHDHLFPEFSGTLNAE